MRRVAANKSAKRLELAFDLATYRTLISLNLWDPLLEAMERPQAQPMRKALRRNVRAVNLHPDSLAEVMNAAPFIQGVYEAQRGTLLPKGPSREVQEHSRQGWIVAEKAETDPPSGFWMGQWIPCGRSWRPRPRNTKG